MISNGQVFHGLRDLSEFFLERKYKYSAVCTALTDDQARTQLTKDVGGKLASPQSLSFSYDAIDPQAFFEYLDSVVFCVRNKLKSMQNNPGLAFDDAKELDRSCHVVPGQIKTQSTFYELYLHSLVARDLLQAFQHTMSKDVMKTRLQNLINQVTHHFTDLIQNMQAQVSMDQRDNNGSKHLRLESLSQEQRAELLP